MQADTTGHDQKDTSKNPSKQLAILMAEEAAIPTMRLKDLFRDDQITILHTSLFQRVYKNKCNQCMLREVFYTNPFPYRRILATPSCARGMLCRSVQLCICHEHTQVEAAGGRAKNQKPKKKNAFYRMLPGSLISAMILTPN